MNKNDIAIEAVSLNSQPPCHNIFIKFTTNCLKISSPSPGSRMPQSIRYLAATMTHMLNITRSHNATKRIAYLLTCYQLPQSIVPFYLAPERHECLCVSDDLHHTATRGLR